MKFRLGAFLSAIITLLLSVAFFVFTAYTVVSSFQSTNTSDPDSAIILFLFGFIFIFWIIILVIGLIGLALGITHLIIAIKKFKIAFCENDKFNYQRHTLKSYRVFDLVFFVICCILSFAAIEIIAFAVIYLLSYLTSLSSNIHFNKLIKNGKVIIKPKEKVVINDSYFMEKELLELEEKLTKGVIKQEEYDTLRKSIIEKYSKKFAGQ